MSPPVPLSRYTCSIVLSGTHGRSARRYTAGQKRMISWHISASIHLILTLGLHFTGNWSETPYD